MSYSWRKGRPVLVSWEGAFLILERQALDKPHKWPLVWYGLWGHGMGWVGICVDVEGGRKDCKTSSMLVSSSSHFANSQALLQPCIWSTQGTLRNAKSSYQIGVWISLSQFILLMQNSVTLASCSLN